LGRCTIGLLSLVTDWSNVRRVTIPDIRTACVAPHQNPNPTDQPMGLIPRFLIPIAIPRPSDGEHRGTVDPCGNPVKTLLEETSLFTRPDLGAIHLDIGIGATETTESSISPWISWWLD